MTAPVVSDDDFIRLFGEHGGRALADILGKNERSIFRRRNRIEKRLGIEIKGRNDHCSGRNPPDLRKYQELAEKLSSSISAPAPAVVKDAGKIKVMVIGDAHDSPDLAKDRFYWMGRWAREEAPDYIVQIGDFLTLDSLNTHIPNDTASGRLKLTFEHDIASGRKAFEEFERGLGSFNPPKHVTWGNHERRAWAYQDANPEVGDLLVGEITDLANRFKWGWTPYGEFFFLNGVGFVHAALNRLGKTYGGKNAEMTICNDAVFDIVIGHSHTERVWTAPKIGPSRHVTVMNAGCALPQGHVEEYAKHNTTGWSWGASMIEISDNHIKDRNFVSMGTLQYRYG